MKKTRQILRHHVSTHESEVNPQEIWDGILEKQKPKKKKIWLHFLFSSVLLATFVTASFLIYHNQNNRPLYSENSFKTDKINSKELTSHITNLQPTSSTQLLKKEYLPTKLNTKNQTLISNSLSNTELTKSNLTKETNENHLSETNEPIVSGFTQSSFTQTNNNQTKNSDALFPHKIQSNTVQLEQSVAFRNVANTESPISRLPLQNYTLVSLQELLPKELDFTTISPPKVIEDLSHSHLSLRLSGGIGIAKSKISSGGKVDEDFILARKTSESSLENISGRIGISYNLTSGLSLVSGIDYMQVNESFKWSGVFLQDADGVDIASLERDEEGALDVAAELFTEDLQHAVDKDIIHFNKYELISIPFIVEYNFVFRRLRSTIYAGTTLNLANISSGRILDLSLLPIDLKNLDSSFSNRYLSGFSFDLPLKRNLSLYAGIELSTQSLTISEVRKQYNILSANLGLQFRVN